MLIFLIVLNISCVKLFAQDQLFILDDVCISDLDTIAQDHFRNTDIQVIRDPRGIILRFKLEDLTQEFYEISSTTYQNMIRIKYFLAKIENPAIIEVHGQKDPKKSSLKYKSWEISTVVANKLETIVSTSETSNRIDSVGYGEFLPAKNTPNNGGKSLNRVDIIIQCNVSGEDYG